jgi:hypothetical protein
LGRAAGGETDAEKHWAIPLAEEWAMTTKVIQGHAVDVLNGMEAESCHLICTSPPYWNLRSYGTEPQIWPNPDGTPLCADGAHEWDEIVHQSHQGTQVEQTKYGGVVTGVAEAQRARKSALCSRSGCWLGELGSEPTVERYIADLVSVFDAVRRVLRRDGLCWVNLSGSYFNNPGGQNGGSLRNGEGASTLNGSNPKLAALHRISAKAIEANRQAGRQDRVGAARSAGKDSWLKPLDFVDTPGMFAHAMQQPRATHCIKQEADRAWMAALVDGEGTITIQKKMHPVSVRQDGEMGGMQYVPLLSVVNTDQNLLQRCVDITGFGTVLKKTEPGIDSRGVRHRLQGYAWRVETDKALEVIRDIFPYLITKKRQAVLANSLDVSNKTKTGALGPHRPVPVEVWERRALLKTLIHACNQRKDGVVLPDWCEEPAPVTMQPGWYWRADIALVKKSPLPESVQGTRWERCRVKVREGARGTSPNRAERHAGAPGANGRAQSAGLDDPEYTTDWADCPGCDKCSKTDGLILRRGNGRPTRAWERFLVFAKAPGAYFDSEAVREPMAASSEARYAYAFGGSKSEALLESGQVHTRPSGDREYNPAGRNLKDWQFWPTTGGVGGLQHFAAFPLGLPDLAIRASTSERGVCPNCKAPWARVVERENIAKARNVAPMKYAGGSDGEVGGRWTAAMAEQTRGMSTTLSWRPTCSCGHDAPVVPAVVLDPFVGSGTTLIAADRLGRSAIGIDVQPTYIDLAAGRARRDAPLFADVEVEGQAAAAEQASKERDLFSVLDEMNGQGEHRPGCGFYEAQADGMDRPWGACDCGLVNHDDD